MPKSSIKRRNGFTLLFKSLAFDKIFLKEFCYAHQLCIYRSSNQKSDWNWMQKNPILYVFVVYIYIRSDISEQIGWQNKWRHSVRFNSCLSSSTTSKFFPVLPFIRTGAHEIVSRSQSQWISAVRGQLSSETSLTGPGGFVPLWKERPYSRCLYSLNAKEHWKWGTDGGRENGTSKHSWAAKTGQFYFRESVCFVTWRTEPREFFTIPNGPFLCLSLFFYPLFISVFFSLAFCLHFLKCF